MKATGLFGLLRSLIICGIALFHSQSPAQTNPNATPNQVELSRFNSLTTEAYALQSKGEKAKAVETFQRAVAFGEKSFGADNPLIYYALSGLAFAHSAAGNYAEAVRYGERATAISERRYGNALASDLLSLASFHNHNWNHKEARTLLERALSLRESVFGTESLEVEEVLSNLAWSESSLGRKTKALVILERCRRILRLKLPDDAIRRAQVEDRISDELASIGELDIAMSISKKTLIDLESKFGTNHPALIWSLEVLARRLGEKADHEAALRVLERTLAISITATGSLSDEVATLHHNIARTLANCGKLDRAIHHAQDGIRIVEDRSGGQSALLLLHLPTLAILLQQKGDYSAAMRTFERSVALAERIHGDRHPLFAEGLVYLAGEAARSGDYERSDELTSRALAIFDQRSGRLNVRSSVCLNLMASSRVNRGDGPGAVERFAELLARIRHSLPEDVIPLGNSIAANFVSRGRLFFEIGHSILLNMEPSTSVRTAIAAQQMAEASALDKAYLMGLQAVQASLDADQQTRTKELREQYQDARVLLAQLPREKLDLIKHEARRRELETGLRRIEAELANRGGLVAQTLRERKLSLQDIAIRLPAHCAFVDFVQYSRFEVGNMAVQLSGQYRQYGPKEEHLAIYITFPPKIGTTNFLVERVDLGEVAPINAAVAEMHQLFAEKRIAPMRLEPVLRRLGALIYAPMARHLTNVEHLFICPDGQLGRLPFELLPVDAKGRFLVEDKFITYVSSGREIARLAQPRPSVPTSAPFVMGSPDFNLDFGLSGRNENAPPKLASRSSELGTNSQTLIAEPAPNRMRSQYISSRGLKFNPLPGSEREARSVATLLGRDAIVRLGAAARESELKAVISPNVLHLATHGFFLTDQEFQHTNSFHEPWRLAGEFTPYPRAQEQDWENPLIRCGIALAGANHAASITNALAEDGLLTGLEASLLNLQGTKLVILSACDTGSGDVKIGEGVMSLRRAFTIAGAETVLASHWKVNDEATSLLMTEFMRRWQAGEPRGQAWRQAQLSLLRSKDYSNPYFWAAFTLTGQWR